MQNSAQVTHHADGSSSVALSAGYTQKDLFFAAVFVQINDYKQTHDARSLESPRVEALEDGGIILHSASHSSKNVNAFKDIIAKSPVYLPWKEVRDKHPLTPNAENKCEGELKTLNDKLVDFLTQFILQFQGDMLSFFSEEIKNQLHDEDMSGFILCAATILAHVIAPSGGRPANNEASAIYAFSGGAVNKFTDKKLMIPAPIDTVKSCCDAMLRLVSSMFTQAIGNEKEYGGMLGKAPRRSSKESEVDETPENKMRDLLEGYDELSPAIVAEAIANVALPKFPCHISDKSFRPERDFSDEEIYQHVVLLNLDFLKQVNNHKHSDVFRRPMLQRLWEAFFTDKRCKDWLKAKKEILLAMIDKKRSLSESNENIALPPEYTKEDLILAVIEVQIPLYGAEGVGNANNARIFEAAKVTLDDHYGVTVSSNPHDSNAVSQFEDAMAAAVETEAWKRVREQYPVQVVSKGTAEERMAVDASKFSREQMAKYFVSFAKYFQEIWPAMQQVIEKKHPETPISHELIRNLAVILNKFLVPATEMGEQDDELRSILAFLTPFQGKFLEEERLKKCNSADDIFHYIMRFASLIITSPIGDEQPYGGAMENKKYDVVAEIFGEGTAYYNKFKRLEPYIIPDECFNVLRGGNENEQALQNFFTFNMGFLNQVDVKKHPELYKATLQRLWDAYLADSRCPEWIKEKKEILAKEIFKEGALDRYVILYSLIEIFSDIPVRIRASNLKSMNGLELELKALTKNTLLTLIQSAKMKYPDKNQRKEAIIFIKEQLSKLIIQYTKEKTLNAGFCLEILSTANNFITSFEKNDLSIEDDSSIEEEPYGELLYRAIEDLSEEEDFANKNFLKDSLEKAKFRFLSMTVFEQDIMLMDVIALKGAIPDSVLFDTLKNLMKLKNEGHLKELVDNKMKGASEALLVFSLGESWIAASSENKFTSNHVLSFLRKNSKLFAKVFEYAMMHGDIFVKNNIFNIVLSDPEALDGLAENLLDAAHKAANKDALSSLAKTLSNKFLSPVETKVLNEKDYELNLISSFDNASLEDSLVVPIYYDVNRIETYIIKLLDQVEKFDAKKSLIDIMNGDLPLYIKLRFVGAIAEGKSMRDLPESPGRLLYKDLQCFFMVRKEDDIEGALKTFLIARKEVPDDVINIEHHKQRLVLIQAQKNNAALAENKQPSFEILFMRWVKFSKLSGATIKSEDLLFSISATQDSVQNCYNTILNSENLSGQQKITFIESLRICCLKNSKDGEEIWQKVDKGNSIENVEKSTDLKTLLDSYETAKVEGNAARLYAIADNINECVPKSDLKALGAHVEKIYPARTSPLGFFMKKVPPPVEVTNIIDLLRSEQSRADILMVLNDVVKTAGYQELSSQLKIVYTAVESFLKTGKVASLLVLPQSLGSALMGEAACTL